MKNNVKKSLVITTLIAGIVACVLQWQAGAALFINGFVWGAFIVLLGNLLILLFTNRLIEQPRQMINVYYFRSLVRIAIVTSVFLVVVFVLEVNALGCIGGIIVTAMISGIMAFVNLRPSLVQKGSE